MSDDDERLTLSRWSRRKHEAARAKAAPEPQPPVPAQPAPAAVAPPPVEAPLPPVESLTLDSDFTRFLGPKVDETVKRAALRKLFSDPRFNVMDGLDVYIDDYSKSDPLPDGMLAKLKDVYQTLTKDEVEARNAADARAQAADDSAPASPSGDEPKDDPPA